MLWPMASSDSSGARVKPKHGLCQTLTQTNIVYPLEEKLYAKHESAYKENQVWHTDSSEAKQHLN